MFKRDIRRNLLELLHNNSRNVIIVEGARQVGKSTLINEALQAYPESVKINLETDLLTLKEIDGTNSFRDLEVILEHRFGVKDEKNKILFIDEAQESIKLGNYVRSFKEQWKDTKVILTGSSMTRLFKERIPVGRYSTILITPLNFYEFLEARSKTSLLDAVNSFAEKPELSATIHKLFLEELEIYFSLGGMPEVIKDYLNGKDWRRTRLEIRLSQQEDFIRKSGISDGELFTQALKGIASHLGYPSKYTHFSDNQYQAKKIINLLQAWKLVVEVPQRGIATTSKFFPKRYLYDIGIAQDLREHPFPNISILNTLSSNLRVPLGGLFENSLLLQLISSPEVYGIAGWKNSSDENKEVDFVVDSNINIPIECKASLKISPRSFYGLREYLKLSEQKSALLLSLAPYQKIKYQKDDGQEVKIINLPFYAARMDIIKKTTSA